MLLFFHMRNEIYTCDDGIIKDNYMSDTNHSTNIKKKNNQLSSQITEQKRPHLPMDIQALSSFRRNHRITPASKNTNRFLHESLLKIWDFFHECKKFRLFTSGAIIGPPMLPNYDMPAQISYTDHTDHTPTQKINGTWH